MGIAVTIAAWPRAILETELDSQALGKMVETADGGVLSFAGLWDR
jgi:hypothetical protein